MPSQEARRHHQHHQPNSARHCLQRKESRNQSIKQLKHIMDFCLSSHRRQLDNARPDSRGFHHKLCTPGSRRVHCRESSLLEATRRLLCRCASGRGADSESWQSRRLQKLRQKQGGASRRAPPAPSSAGTSRRGSSRVVKEHNQQADWQQELLQRQGGAADAHEDAASGGMSASSRAVNSGARLRDSPPLTSSKNTPPPASTAAAAPPHESTEQPEEDDDDNVPARLKRSAVPKPFRLPPSGVRLTSRSSGPVLRSSKRRSSGPAAVMDVYEQARARHREGNKGPSGDADDEQSSAGLRSKGAVAAERKGGRAVKASTARRQTRRGKVEQQGEASEASTLFEASLMSSVNMDLEELLHVSGGGVNRACLGQGELHWYKLNCKEGRQNEAVRELQRTAGLRAVVVPLRKVKSVSDSGRATWRKVKYEHGSAILALGRLTMGDIKAVEAAKSLSHSPAPCWWHHVAYSSVRTQQQSPQGAIGGGAPEPLILPRPMTEEELREVAEFESSGPASRTEPTEFAALERDRLRVSGHYADPF